MCLTEMETLPNARPMTLTLVALLYSVCDTAAAAQQAEEDPLAIDRQILEDFASEAADIIEEGLSGESNANLFRNSALETAEILA